MTHAADGDVPVAGAAADHVVEEAPVLAQALVVGVREGADESVGQRDAAGQIALQRRAQQLAERPIDECRPERVVAQSLPQLAGARERVGHRREDRARNRCEPFVEGGEALGLGRVAGRAEEGGGRGCGIRCIDEDAATRVAGIGRVRREPASAQRDAQAEIVDDALGQQAHEVGVAREAGVDAVPRPFRHRRASGVREPLEHDDPLAGAGEIGGGGETVVPAADDDDVVDRGTHPPTLARGVRHDRRGRARR